MIRPKYVLVMKTFLQNICCIGMNSTFYYSYNIIITTFAFEPPTSSFVVRVTNH